MSSGLHRSLVAGITFLCASSSEAAILGGHVPAAVAESRAVDAVAPSSRLRLALGLPLRNQDQLEKLLSELADPSSANYRHYVTPEQFAERFGPSKEDYQALSAFFESRGFTITGTHPNRMILDVSGTVSRIEDTFHVRMLRWSHPQRGIFFSPDREPSLDAGVEVLDVTGLDNFVVPQPMDIQVRPLVGSTAGTGGSGPSGLYIGNDFRSAYAPSVRLSGAGQSIGLFELDGFHASDVEANFRLAGLPAVPVRTVLADSFNGAPGTGNAEVVLDIMMAAYMAPGANIIVYEGNNWNDVLNRMATDDEASQLSSSWTFSPTNATTEQIFEQMIAQGQSFFQASGDRGAYQGAIPSPADDPHVTVVGGTSLSREGATGAWQSETTWAGSGGGSSEIWPIPTYQMPALMTAAGGSGTMRNIPDVALVSAKIFLICDNGQSLEVAGTSAAAPLWAGFLALANQQAAANNKARVGFLNPAIYALGGDGSSFVRDLHDITSGGNDGFIALPGYDLATGWGTPAGQPLIDDLVGAPNPSAFELALSEPRVTISPGATGVSTVVVHGQPGSGGTVNLSVSALPSGVRASFSPATAATSSTLRLVAGRAAAAGTSVLTITGASSGIISSARLSVTIAPSASFNSPRHRLR